MYAKFIDSNTLEYAPKSITVGRTHYNPVPFWWREENGYKPVRYTDPPECEEGFYPVSYWTETENEIVQEWEIVPIPEGEPAQHTESSLSAMSNAELAEICSSFGFTGSMNRTVMIYLILHAQEESA